MPVDLQELCDTIVNIIAVVDVTFLNKLWDRLKYHLDVCHITRGSNLEHLQKNLEMLTGVVQQIVLWYSYLFYHNKFSKFYTLFCYILYFK
jgi:spore coat protein CotH